MFALANLLNIKFFKEHRVKMKIFVLLLVSIVGFTLIFNWFQSSPANNIITINPKETFQTINGWEVLAWIGQYDTPYQIENVHKWNTTVADLAVNNIGINRIRLEIYAGAENPVDYFTQYVNKKLTHKEWSTHWYDIINDNNNAFKIDSKGFQFTQIDYTIDSVVLPLRTFLQANDEDLYINLNYVDFDPSTFEHNINPEEYGEFILAVFEHMDSKYGFVPNAVEVILEPDFWTRTDCWNNPTIVAKALLAAAKRLESEGYRPDFIAPATMNMRNASKYFDKMIASTPKILKYIKEISYHRYGGVSSRNLKKIAKRGEKYGVRTSMLEWWNDDNSYKTLHEDLKTGCNSAWQVDALAGIGRPDNSPILYKIDRTVPDKPKVIMNNSSKYFRQYFKFVRSGAVRIKATSNNDNYDPIAFINTNGDYVVIVSTSGGGFISVQGLPAGTYGIKYTTGRSNSLPKQYNIDLPDQSISSGQTLNTCIPTTGIITIFAR